MVKIEQLKTMYWSYYHWEDDWQGWLDGCHFSLICKKGTHMEKHFDTCYEYHQVLTLEDIRKRYQRDRDWIVFKDYNIHVQLIKPALRLFGWDITFYISNDLVPIKITTEESEYIMYVAPYLAVPDEQIEYFDTPDGFMELSGCKCPDMYKKKKMAYNDKMPFLQ